MPSLSTDRRGTTPTAHLRRPECPAHSSRLRRGCRARRRTHARTRDRIHPRARRRRQTSSVEAAPCRPRAIRARGLPNKKEARTNLRKERREARFFPPSRTYPELFESRICYGTSLALASQPDLANAGILIGTVERAPPKVVMAATMRLAETRTHRPTSRTASSMMASRAAGGGSGHAIRSSGGRVENRTASGHRHDGIFGCSGNCSCDADAGSCTCFGRTLCVRRAMQRQLPRRLPARPIASSPSV
jgi:hypothetical protein